MKKLFYLIIWTLVSTPATAGTVKILTLKNLDDRSVYDLHIETNEEDHATGLMLYDHTEKDWVEWDVSKISQGLPVKEEGSHKVIVLRSRDFEKDRGGHFTVDYLKNGITGKRGSMPMEFDFDGHGWKVYHQGIKVTRLDFKLNKVFGKAVGISQVIAR